MGKKVVCGIMRSMKTYYETIEQGKQLLISQHRKFTFPKFIRYMRALHHLSRQDLEELGVMNRQNLYLVENGAFKSIEPYRVDKLSDFFEIDHGLLYQKALDYISDRAYE